MKANFIEFQGNWADDSHLRDKTQPFYLNAISVRSLSMYGDNKCRIALGTKNSSGRNDIIIVNESYASVKAKLNDALLSDAERKQQRIEDFTESLKNH